MMDVLPIEVTLSILCSEEPTWIKMLFAYSQRGWYNPGNIIFDITRDFQTALRYLGNQSYKAVSEFPECRTLNCGIGFRK